MEKKTLKTMIDFIVKTAEKPTKDLLCASGQVVVEFYECLDYAQLLKQKPKLGQFVPTNKNGKYLEEPIRNNSIYAEDIIGMSGKEAYEYDLKEYQEAQERVLFVGWEYDSKSNEGVYITNGVDRMHFDFTNTHAMYIPLKDINKSKRIKTLEDLTPYGLEIK